MSPNDSFAYRALGVAEPFGRAGVAGVDPGARTVGRLSSGASLPYDSLVLAVGAHAYPRLQPRRDVRPRARAEDLDELLADVDARLVPHVAVVVPEHVGWTLPAYEPALATAAYGRRPLGRDIAVTLVTHEPQPLAALGTTVSRAVTTRPGSISSPGVRRL